MKFTNACLSVLAFSVCAQTLAKADSSEKYIFCFSELYKSDGAAVMWNTQSELLKQDRKTPMGDVLISSVEELGYFGTFVTPDKKYFAMFNISEITESTANFAFMLDGKKADGSRQHYNVMASSNFKDIPIVSGKKTKIISFLTDWLDTDGQISTSVQCVVGSQEALAEARQYIFR